MKTGYREKVETNFMLALFPVNPFSFLCVSRSRSRCFMAIAAKHRTADLWLKGYLVVFAAMVANYFKSLRRIGAGCGLFCSAFMAPLRRH